MIDFIKPGVRVYTGEGFSYPAVIDRVMVGMHLMPQYCLEYWRDGTLVSIWVWRHHFSLNQGVPDTEHEIKEISS